MEGKVKVSGELTCLYPHVMKLNWLQIVTDGGEEEMTDTLILTKDAGMTQTAGFRGLHMVSEGSTWVSVPSVHINGSCRAAYFSCDDIVSLKELCI